MLSCRKQLKWTVMLENTCYNSIKWTDVYPPGLLKNNNCWQGVNSIFISSCPEDSVFAMLWYQYSHVKAEEKIAVVIFNFTSAHAVEDFEFDWPKRILKFYIKRHTHTAEKNIINKHQQIFLFSTEKQFCYKYWVSQKKRPPFDLM